jgi:hypothetical protein
MRQEVLLNRWRTTQIDILFPGGILLNADPDLGSFELKEWLLWYASIGNNVKNMGFT